MSDLFNESDIFSPRQQDMTLGNIVGGWGYSHAIYDNDAIGPRIQATVRPPIPWHAEALAMRDALRLEGMSERNIGPTISARLGKSRPAVWAVLTGVDNKGHDGKPQGNAAFIKPHKRRAIRQTINRKAIQDIIANREGAISVDDLMKRIAA